MWHLSSYQINQSSTTHYVQAVKGELFKRFPVPITVDPIKPQWYCYEGVAFVMESATSPVPFVAQWHSKCTLWFYADTAVTGYFSTDNVLIRRTLHRKRVMAVGNDENVFNRTAQNKSYRVENNNMWRTKRRYY